MKYILYLSLLILTCGASAQTPVFHVKEYFIKDSLSFTVNRDTIFEDADYVIRRTCSGEWGGSIHFIRKRDSAHFIASATCPVVVNKLDSVYYVTSTLAHMNGSSSVIAIRHPDSLKVFVAAKPMKKRKKGVGNWFLAMVHSPKAYRYFYYFGYNESSSRQGTVSLLDTSGVITMASFPYQGNLYHIVTMDQKTVLCHIVDGKYVPIMDLSATDLWTYNSVVYRRKEDNHMLLSFKNEEAEGYFDIFENEIKIVRYR